MTPASAIQQKAMSAPTDIITVKQFDRYVVYDRAFAGAALDTLLKDPDAPFAGAEPEHTLKHDRTTTLVKLADENMYLVGKRYNTKNLWHAIRRSFKPTRAWNCWQMSHALQAAGLHTARPVAMIEQRFGPLRRRSFYFCEYLTGTPLEKIINPGATQQTIETMCEKFVALFRVLASRCIAHGDLKITNLLWVDDEIVLLDLDVVAVFPAHRYGRAYRKDRARFLRNWDHMPALREHLAELIPEQPA